MTREEAIEALKYSIGVFPVTDRAVSALDMAIKALEQEPCEDAISRQAAINAVCDSECHINQRDCNLHSGRCFTVWRLEKSPSVNPQEPKTGHWIERPEIKTSAPEYLMFYECSECGDKQCFCKLDIHKKHFCNYCGAKMIEPQESEGSDAGSD